jgi:transposase
MTAMTCNGVLQYEATTGTVNSDKFIDFIRGQLVPNMQPFPGDNSILILDNCSIHHTHEVQQLLGSLGVLLFFLPPYSPDYNPIEELFSYLKHYLKAHDDIIQVTDDPLPLIYSALHNVSKSHCDGWISHSGYC